MLKRISLQLALAAVFLTTPVALAEAEAAWEKALEAAESALQKNEAQHVDTNIAKALAEAPAGDDTIRATIENQIGIIRMHQKRYLDAHKAYSTALELRMKTVGPQDPLTLQTTSNLALAEHKLGNEQKAEELYKKAVEAKRRLNPASTSLALSLTNLGHLYSDMRRCKDAQTVYIEALGIDSTVFGGEHKEVAADLYNLGSLLYHCNEFAQSLVYFERARKVYDALKDDVGHAKSLHYIALCHHAMNQHEKAAESALAALKLHETAKGQGHHDTLIHMLNAADALDASGNRAKAEALYKRALAHAEASKTPSNFKLAETNLEMGTYYLRHGDKVNAEHFFKRALAHYDSLPKRDRRSLYELPVAYAKLLADTKRPEESDELSRKYLDVFQPTQVTPREP
jgi:tetratricopeptide (TPR) repeat protein